METFVRVYLIYTWLETNDMPAMSAERTAEFDEKTGNSARRWKINNSHPIDRKRGPYSFDPDGVTQVLSTTAF